MTQEEKLQKRLNEICFPDHEVKEWFKTNEFYLVRKDGNLEISQTQTYQDITLDLVLKALSEKLGYVELIQDLNSDYYFINCQSSLTDVSMICLWAILQPFSQQPTETKEALFRIFEITDN